MSDAAIRVHAMNIHPVQLPAVVLALPAEFGEDQGHYGEVCWTSCKDQLVAEWDALVAWT